MSITRFVVARHPYKVSDKDSPQGDRINAVLAAAGYNFSLLLRWLAELLRAFILEIARINSAAQTVS
jgi:hypothetical protein